MSRVGVIRNFTIGQDATGKPAAFFDCYYDESSSVPVTVVGVAILDVLRAAGLFTRASTAVNGLPVILTDSATGPTFSHLATF